MQCFICVTYMIILCGASPTKTREVATTHEKRSLFRDVIESLRIRAQLPEDFNQNDDNNLSQNFDVFIYDNEPAHLPSDAEYIPRRNDRIEMPSMKYRFPKSVNFNQSSENEKLREELVVYIDTNRKSTTQKPKKDKPRPRPNLNKNKYQNNKNKENEDEEVTNEPEDGNGDFTPLTNTMAGQSQIGNRESQTVVKPTVIVNIRGSVNHRDSDIRLEGRETLDNKTDPVHTIFNINQEIKIGPDMDKKKGPNVSQDIKLVPDKQSPKTEEDMMMCETATWKNEKSEENRKFDSVFQILFSI